MHPTNSSHSNHTHCDKHASFPTVDKFAVESCAPGRYVLYLGTGSRAIADQLRKKLCNVTAIDPILRQNWARSTTAKLAPRLPANAAWFDEILVMDLIEQLDDAQSFLNDLRRKMARRGAEVVITVGNIGCCVSRFMRLLLPFSVRRLGIPAKGSKRSFTLNSLQSLLAETGFEVVEARGVPTPFPVTMGNSRWSRALLKLNQLLLRISKPLFAYQICVRARPASPIIQDMPEPVAASATLPGQMLGRVA